MQHDAVLVSWVAKWYVLTQLLRLIDFGTLPIYLPSLFLPGRSIGSLYGCYCIKLECDVFLKDEEMGIFWCSACELGHNVFGRGLVYDVYQCGVNPNLFQLCMYAWQAYLFSPVGFYLDVDANEAKIWDEWWNFFHERESEESPMFWSTHLAVLLVNPSRYPTENPTECPSLNTTEFPRMYLSIPDWLEGSVWTQCAPHVTYLWV